jgi:hypothetical protein
MSEDKPKKVTSGVCVICGNTASYMIPNRKLVCEKHFDEYKLFKKCGFLEPGFKLVPFKEFTPVEKEKAIKALEKKAKQVMIDD